MVTPPHRPNDPAHAGPLPPAVPMSEVAVDLGALPELPGAGVKSLPHRPGARSGRLGDVAAPLRLHWSAWAAVVPFAVVSLLTARASARAHGMESLGTAAYMFASVLWGVVAACAVGWVAWRVRGKTNTAATVAFLTALALIGTTGAIGTARRNAAQEATIQALRAKASADIAEAGRHTQLATDHAFDCLKTDGGLSLRGVTTMAQLDRRLGLFDDVLRAVRVARQAPEVVHARLHADLVAGRIPPTVRQRVLEDFRNEVHWEADRRIDNATERLLTAGRNQLTFVRLEWGGGRLKLDRQTGQVTFHDKRAAERYKKLTAEVLTANAALRAAVKEAVGEIHARANSGTGTVSRATGAIAGAAHELTPADAGE